MTPQQVFARRKGEEVIAEFDRGADASPDLGDPAVAVVHDADALCQGGRSPDRPSNLIAAIDLLERQACNCDLLKAGPCLRCELLALLGSA